MYSLGKELAWKCVTSEESCVRHVKYSDLATELRKLKSGIFDNLFVLTTTVLLGCLSSHNHIEE